MVSKEKGIIEIKTMLLNQYQAALDRGDLQIAEALLNQYTQFELLSPKKNKSIYFAYGALAIIYIPLIMLMLFAMLKGGQ